MRIDDRICVLRELLKRKCMPKTFQDGQLGILAKALSIKPLSRWIMEDFGNILIRQVNDLKGFVINPYGENISISKQLLLSLLQQHETKMREKMGN